MKIGIFGGSFDPVHNAHLALGRTALAELSLDELIWVPTGHAWQKQHALSPMADREAMLRLALDGEARCSVSRIELERSGPSYMLETVRELQAERPHAQWFLVIGQDQHAGFNSWRGWQELIALVTLAVAQRPGAGTVLAPEVEHTHHVRLPLPLTPVSSTDIRARVAAGHPVDGLVPVAVARYIARHHLYRVDPRANAEQEPHPKEIPLGN